MGNTGSAHNLHNEGVESELSNYYTQQYLRRTNCDTRKKGNQSIIESWPGKNIAECKVLPQQSESLKLRATTNGAILQAGGTISFRSKEQLEERLGLPVSENILNIKLQPMRRCHTLILDGQSDSLSQRKTDSPLVHFQRSQTLIHVGYNKTKSQENIETISKFQDELKKRITQTSANTQLTTPKINKYNKKRKAPPAPTKDVLVLDSKNKGNILSAEPKNSLQSKPRIYATNASKACTPHHSQPFRNKISPPRTFNIAPLQKGSNVRKLTSPLGTDLKTNNAYDDGKLPYRREKSFDNILLRHNVGKEYAIERKSMPNTNLNFVSRKNTTTQHVAENTSDVTNRITNGDSGKKKLTRHNPSNNIANTALKSQCTKYGNKASSEQKEDTNLSEKKSNLYDVHLSNSFKSGTAKLNDSKIKSGDEPLPSERKSKSQQTRIPQLKRTFYFGMKVPNENVNRNNLQNFQNKNQNYQLSSKSEDRLLDNDDVGCLLNHNIEPEEEINDNGIYVHVRPTLPRRQPETPSFSPAAAWRNLLEEQQLLQHERSKQKLIKSSNNVRESPIYLASDHKTNVTSAYNWTPQQDLGDDDEDDDKNGNRDNITSEENKFGHKRQTSYILHKLDRNFQNTQSTRPQHTFSLSLPRDVHLQCQMENSVNETEQENNLKMANCWLVAGFNSLQKFKTNLGKNIDASRPPSKCICITKRSSYNLSNVFGESCPTDDIEHQPDCRLYKPNNFHNDNWVLHKSGLHVPTSSAVITQAADSNNLKSSSLYLQPKSLKSIYGGKHIVYLPGQESINSTPRALKKTPQQKQRANKPAYKRQRQEVVRESLQDITPLQHIHQSNVSIPEKNTHRFSFQSTVRVLEKRRLAEKLSKDAEIQEAQRLHELEAMKRVEEDFQRKRAPEKANLRNQLRLHLKASSENEEYRSLPLNLNDKSENYQQSQQQKVSDVNNNIFCRAEPDGAVSPTLDCNDNLKILKNSNQINSSLNIIEPLRRRFDVDGDDSESETQTSDLQFSAMLTDPYLKTII